MTALPRPEDDNVLPLFAAKPTTSVVYVTPEMAQRWLTYNHRNRPVRMIDVRALARDMAAGAWRLTGESIKFGTDGLLLDGQHRLAAIVMAQTTVAMFVARGIPDEAQQVMDTGRKRTAADALAIGGSQHTALLAATARLAIAIEVGAGDPGRHQVTHAEVQDWVQRHPEITTRISDIKGLCRKTDCPPSVVALTYWRLAQIDLVEAYAFWHDAAEKVGLKAGDPVIAMTNRFAEARRNRESLSRPILLSLVYRAWNTRRTGKPLRILRVNSPAGGVVPIPEPR